MKRPQTNAVALSGDGRRAATGHLDGTIAIWDVPACRVTAKLQLPKLLLSERLNKLNGWAINALAMSGDGQLLLAGGKDLRLALWDLDLNKVRHMMPGHLNSIHSVAMSRDAGMGLSGGWAGEVHAWDLRTGDELWSKPFSAKGGHNADAVAFSSDGRLAVVLFSGLGVVAYDARTGGEVCAFRDPSFAGLTCMTAAADPDIIAVGDDSGGVRLLSMKDRQVKAVLSGHRNRTARLAFAPDQTRMISSGYDGLVRIWDLTTGRQTRALPGIENAQQDLALSGDGRFVAVAGLEGVQLRSLSLHSSDVTVPAAGSRPRMGLL